MNRKTSALDALAPHEKAAVLEHLLAAQPELREPAEAFAVSLVSDEDRSAVANDVEDALQSADIDEINGRAGHQPGRGYVDPGEAADEILDEMLDPFIDDLERRARLGLNPAAAELAAGILLGLYQCREGEAETLLEYSPDYAAERAAGLLSQYARLGIELPRAELRDAMPEWSSMLD
jgi:hypothetical protein